MSIIIQSLLALMLIPLNALAADPPNQSAIESQFFTDKPYELNLGLLQAIDPKPIKIQAFSPDPNPKSKGLRIISTGRIFPYVYEIMGRL